MLTLSCIDDVPIIKVLVFPDEELNQRRLSEKNASCEMKVSPILSESELGISPPK